MPADVLIVTDADVRGLAACAAAAVDHGPGQVLAVLGSSQMTNVEQTVEAAREQAQAFEHQFTDFAPVVPAHASPAEQSTRCLLEAAFIASRQGLREVIWAEHAPNGEIGIAALLSRATLVERLVGLESTRSPRIRLPYSDLSDRQMADLILDMDLPIWLCWWWSLARGPRGAEGFEPARRCYEHWEELLREAGWTEGMPGPAALEEA